MKNELIVLGVIFTTSICLSAEVRLAPIALGSSPAAAVESPATVKVRGKGVGVTKAEALKDAYRDAVERAVGLFVDAEQFVKNDELIKDQILTQSNAYIKKCQEVGDENEGGLVRVTILAEVVKSAVTKRISDVMPPQTYNLGSDGLNVHAQMVSTMKRNQDAAALVKNTLEGFHPIKKLMKVGLQNLKPNIDLQGGRDGVVKLSYLMKVELDRKAYFQEVAPRLKQVLDQVAIKPPKVVRLADVSSKMEGVTAEVKKVAEYSKRPGVKIDDRWPEGLSGLYDGVGILGGSLFGKKGYLEPDTWALGYFFAWHGVCGSSFRLRANGGEEGEIPDQILLVTEANAMSCKALLYTVDPSVGKVLQDWKRTVGKETVEYTTIFKKDDGEELGAFPWIFEGGRQVRRLSPVMSISSTGASSKQDVIVISHLVYGCAKRYIEWRTFEFQSEDVAKIASVTIELAE